MKNMAIITIITCLVLISVNEVQAKTCTDYQPAPYMYEVAPDVKGPTFDLTTEADACKGSNTEVWFRGYRAFPSNYEIQDGAIHVRLWEEDPEGNDDEQVKYYMGTFYNKVITEFRLLNTFITGNIDSAGDQKCELYLTFAISGLKCCYVEFKASVFDYNICMN